MKILLSRIIALPIKLILDEATGKTCTHCGDFEYEIPAGTISPSQKAEIRKVIIGPKKPS
jgi:hypothetical protein